MSRVVNDSLHCARQSEAVAVTAGEVDDGDDGSKAVVTWGEESRRQALQGAVDRCGSAKI